MTTTPQQRIALTGLNDQQLEAVTTTKGPVLIIAGPGSGKTRVITQRIAYLIAHSFTPPHGIAAVTFTNKAAAEMTNRIDAAGIIHNGAYIGTFHRLCGQILRNHGEHIGLTSNYSVYDREDQNSVARRAMEIEGIDPRRYKPAAIINHISLAKAKLQNPGDFQKAVFHTTNQTEYTAGIVYPRYQALMTEANALDYDDMLMRAVQLLEKSDDVRRRYHQRFRYIMVDEFQDTNRAQMELTRLLTGPEQNLCIVGDPDQSIYGWRAADIDNILKFQDNYPTAAEIHLGMNYRSTPEVVSAASQLISYNTLRIPNHIFTTNPSGDPVIATYAQDPNEEAKIIFDHFQELRDRYEYKWQDFSAMYRGNQQSRVLEDQCLHRGIPYRIFGGIQFYQRREVKDVLAYLRMLANPADTAALQRIINVPPRDIGAKTISRITQYANTNEHTLLQAVASIAQPDLSQIWQDSSSEETSFSKRAVAAISNFHDLVESLQSVYRYATVAELFDAMIELTHIREYIENDEDAQERWANIVELRSLAMDFNTFATDEEGLEAFLFHTALSTNESDPDNPEGVLTLTTLHSAKGLEFPAVAIAGMSDATMPHPHSDDIEEERRLCYVGITRAKNHLIMTAPLSYHGKRCEPSRFLDEIESIQWLVN